MDIRAEMDMRIKTKPCEYDLDMGPVESVDHRDNVNGSARLTHSNV